MNRKSDRLAEARALYGRMMAAASASTDPRIGKVFETLPREDFLPPGPWHMLVAQQYVETPSDDPVHLYRNALVALDPERGINNGEPFLHAAWIGAVAPQPGETVIHIGAGGGYYTAALSLMVEPGGKVFAYEIDARLADMAKRNLAPYENVKLIRADAVKARLRKADIIYVNAGVIAPPVRWLKSLKLGGRMIFPWRPTPEIGLAVLADAKPHRLSHADRRRFLVHSLQRRIGPCAEPEGAVLPRGKDVALDRADGRAAARQQRDRDLSGSVVFVRTSFDSDRMR